MALPDLTALDEFSATGPPPGAGPHDPRTLFSPVDQVHAAIQAIVASATQSVVLAMYGFDDDQLADLIKHQLADEHLFVQLTLDQSQAGGVHEKEILAHEAYPASSVACGKSERGAIMHLKTGVVDGIITFNGSTNWSASGESLQDNQLTVTWDPVLAARTRSRIDAIHAHMVNAKAAP